jgi:hypothetical protein
MCKGLPDRGREKSQGRQNHLQQQVTDDKVLSRIILISFQKITCPYFLAVLFRLISSCKREYIL